MIYIGKQSFGEFSLPVSKETGRRMSARAEESERRGRRSSVTEGRCD